MNEPLKDQAGFGRILKSLGPALIVASVVLGPGSISTSSKVGAAHGFSMIWLLVLAVGLMMGMVALGARLGLVLKGSMCDELAERLGRPFAALIGITIFLICAGFQFGNNIGVLIGLDPLFTTAKPAELAEAQFWQRICTVQNGVLLFLNFAIIGFLWGSRHLYKPVERLMMVLVGLMILAFFSNFAFLLIAGTPEATEEVTLVEQEAIAAASENTPEATEEKTEEATPAKPAPNFDLIALLGLVGTTFSVAGAFYQSYLVREKKWTLANFNQGIIDSVTGISVLGLITLVIMLTAAISFHGRGIELKDAGDVARQLEPLFGSWALILFSCGIFAAAFSSFLVNAMIGGAMLADGFGFGGSMDGKATKLFTTLAMLIGLLVAVFIPSSDRVGLIVFAQAMVVIAFPLLAISMLYLATRPDLIGQRRIPLWMKGVALVGSLVVVVSAIVSANSLVEKLAGKSLVRILYDLIDFISS